MLHMSNLELSGKRLLIREDLNVPIRDGRIQSQARLEAALPTLRLALAAGAGVILVSHLGRPEEGMGSALQSQFSLRPVAAWLSAALHLPVTLIENWRPGSGPANARLAIAPGEIVLLENIRFTAGEKDNDPRLATDLADLCDIFVMDAFGVAHRAHASTCGVADKAPLACAGPLLAAEIRALDDAMQNPARPLLALVGGAKISTKLNLLKRLSALVDQLVVGGGIANTFLAAEGCPVGRSLYEPGLIPMAKEILATGKVLLPIDLIAASAPDKGREARVYTPGDLAPTDSILDLGPATRALHLRTIMAAATIIWNGPAGAFEWPGLSAGTAAWAEAVGASSGFSIAGGGDTLAAIERFGDPRRISRVCTAGGAFLAYIEGQELPAIAALRRRVAV